MRKTGLPLFFALAFVLPWLVWFTGIAQHAGIITWHVPDSLAFWLGLTIATYAAAALSGGWPAVKDLLLRLVRARVRPLWYVTGLVTTPVIAVTAAAVGAVIGSPAKVATGDLASLPAVLALNVWLFLLTEETAWRGFALPRLQARMNPLPAALLLGLVWGLWHIPLFLKPDSFQASIPFAGFMVSILATSVITSWIFNHTRGSVLLAALFHAVTDVSIAFLGVMSSGAVLFWIFAGLQVVVAAGVAAFLRPEPGRLSELTWPPSGATTDVLQESSPTAVSEDHNAVSGSGQPA